MIGGVDDLAERTRDLILSVFPDAVRNQIEDAYRERMGFTMRP